ncbi:MAG: hypothetical protein NT165_00635 [Candidatus Falkowbacteria bacterium]|nr:hypothetical protein [Candidatus Falkowbacteria bacterium]
MMEYNENIGKAMMGIIISLVIVFVFISQSYIKKERAIPLEVRVAEGYCSNLKPSSDDFQAECEDGVLADIVNKFETLELCQQEMAKDHKTWSREDWLDCYNKRADVISSLSR